MLVFVPFSKLKYCNSNGTWHVVLSLFNAKKILILFLFCGKKKQHPNYSSLITSLLNLILVLWV